jgi:hypothetical protein
VFPPTPTHLHNLFSYRCPCLWTSLWIFWQNNMLWMYTVHMNAPHCTTTIIQFPWCMSYWDAATGLEVAGACHYYRIDFQCWPITVGFLKTGSDNVCRPITAGFVAKTGNDRTNRQRYSGHYYRFISLSVLAMNRHKCAVVVKDLGGRSDQNKSCRSLKVIQLCSSQFFHLKSLWCLSILICKIS